MDKSEVIKQFKQEAVRSSFPIHPKGGQTVGRTTSGITLEHKDLGFSISINNYRSQLQNLELAYTLFELYLEEILHE